MTEHAWAVYPHEKPLLVGVDISQQPGRYRKMTASAASGAVGLTKYAYPQVLAHHFHDRSFVGNQHTMRGHIMEPVTRYLLGALTYGLMPIRTCGIFTCPEIPFFSATPDDLAFAEGQERVLEYKSVDPGTPRDAPKVEHIGQVHWQMMCSGLETHGYLVYNYFTLPRPEVVEADDGTPEALVLDPSYRPTLEDAERLTPLADRVLEMFRRRWPADDPERCTWSEADAALVLENMRVWKVCYSPAFVGWMTERALEFGFYVDCPLPEHLPSYNHLYFAVNRALHAGTWGRGPDSVPDPTDRGCPDPAEWPPSPTVVDITFRSIVAGELLESECMIASASKPPRRDKENERLNRGSSGSDRGRKKKAACDRYKIVPAEPERETSAQSTRHRHNNPRPTHHAHEGREGASAQKPAEETGKGRAPSSSSEGTITSSSSFHRGGHSSPSEKLRTTERDADVPATTRGQTTRRAAPRSPAGVPLRAVPAARPPLRAGGGGPRRAEG